MAKVLVDKYPMGTLSGQRTAGRYMEGYLKENLDVLADTIANDMTYLGIVYSSTLEVRTGKSTLVQHIGEYYTDAVNRKYKLNIPFNINNIVFKAKDLIKRAFELPKYSCLILDEGDDMDIHYFSTLAKSIRTFFRKCGQLNLFMIIIIPNFFQLPTSYAIGRSVFAIDVKFEQKFERGFFSFYSFDRKKDLYIKGKKFQDYKVVSPNFNGRFTKGYAVDENEYRAAKLRDMKEENEDKITIPRDAYVVLYQKLRKAMPLNTMDKLNDVFAITQRTGLNWLYEKIEDNVVVNTPTLKNNINTSIILTDKMKRQLTHRNYPPSIKA